MKFTIYMDPGGSVTALNPTGAVLGGGMPMDDFQREFDGSSPIIEFEIPPPSREEPLDYTPPVLTDEQAWEIARVVYEACTRAADEAWNRRDEGPVHSIEHGREAEQLRSGIESLIKNPSEVSQDEVDMWGHEFHYSTDVVFPIQLQELLDRVDAVDSAVYVSNTRKDQDDIK